MAGFNSGFGYDNQWNSPGSPFGSGSGAGGFGQTPGGFGQGAGGFGGQGGGSGFYGGGIGGGFQTMQKNIVSRFGTSFLIGSIIAAVLFFVLGELLYHTGIENINSIVFMEIYFLVFGLVLATAIFIVARINGMEFSAKGLLVTGICLVVLLVFGMLFEFLYELNPSTTQPLANQFVFAIDNSGSMAESDPDQKRIAAIQQLLNGQKSGAEFSVYTFSEDIRCLREMGPVSGDIADLAIQPDGGTPIVGVLEQIMDDMNSGALPHKEGTQVILLTDGYATDTDFFSFRLNRILREFNKKKVSVSTVGLGDVDESFLNNISGKTGGISVTTDNVDELGQAMNAVVRTTSADRNLLSPRAQTGNNFLYGFLRILFLTILGLVFAGIKVALTDDSASVPILLISSLICSILAAVLVEVGLNLFLTGFFARLFYCILVALTITMVEREIMGGAAYGQMSIL